MNRCNYICRTICIVFCLVLIGNASSAFALNPEGHIYGGSAKNKDKETAATKAKRQSRNNASEKCTKHCSPKTVCGFQIDEPGEPACTLENKTYTCLLSDDASDKHHGCKLTKCECCTGFETDPVILSEIETSAQSSSAFEE